MDLALLRRELEAANDGLSAIAYQLNMICRHCEHGKCCRDAEYTRRHYFSAMTHLSAIRTHLGWDHGTGTWKGEEGL